MSPYVSIFVLCALSAIICGVMVSLNRVLGPTSPPSDRKLESFECGNPPATAAWGRFTIKFYLTAILFIIFDLEVVFLYPWAVLVREMGVFGFVEMLLFLTILTVGLAYAWRKGALDWD